MRLQKLVLESCDLRLLSFAAVGHDGTRNEMEVRKGGIVGGIW